MAQNILPQVLEDALTQAKPEAVFAMLLPALGDILQAERCFLHLRNPLTRFYQNICWRHRRELLDTSTVGWKHEQEWEKEDPLFAAALRTEDSIFVEDVETAPPSVLNLEFERKYLGHRALIHAHLIQDKRLWGILQPSIFAHPKVWSDSERWIIAQVTQKLTPIAISYIKTAGV